MSAGTMQGAYGYQREIVKDAFPDLSTKRRVLHFANPVRAADLVQTEIDPEAPAENRVLLPAIQLYPPMLQPVRTGSPKRDWLARVAIVSPKADELMPLADVLLEQVNSTGRAPKRGMNPTTEYEEGPGYWVVFVRFHFFY